VSTEVIKIEESIGKALFRREKVDNLIKKVRDVWKIDPPDSADLADLDETLAHMKRIANERNLIVHTPALVVGDKGRLRTNIMRAATNEQVEEVEVSPDFLDGMTSDLKIIAEHLAVTWLHKNHSKSERDGMREGYGKPWEYVPPSEVQRTTRMDGN
jgi:hypothetical protein